MSERLLPEDLGDILRDVVRRLENLEGSSRLARSSIRDGVLQLLDSNGDLRGQVGKLIAAGGAGDRWGIEVVKQPGSVDWPNGEPFFRVTEDGAEFPYLSMPMVNEALIATVTSGTFTATWSAGVGLLTHKAISSLVWVTTPVGTTAEIRLRERNGATTTPAVTVPSGSNTYFSIPAYQHGLTLWTGAYIFDVEARRTGGAGNVDVHQPALGLVCSPR